jgi:hypothetical protein
LSVKKENEAERALRQAHGESERAKRVQEQAKSDNKERYEAQQKVRQIEYATNRSKLTYKTLFIGNNIFTLVLAFFVAFSKREVLLDMLKWFPLRFNNLKSLLSWIAIKYMAAIQFIQTKWELKSIWSYVIVTLIFIGIGVGLFFIVKKIIKTTRAFIKNIQEVYTDKLFKRIISGNIALGMLFVCLFFSVPIQRLLPFNILSLWLIFSFTGIAVWHIPEIKKVIEYSKL